MPPGGCDAPDSTEDLGAKRSIGEGKGDLCTQEMNKKIAFLQVGVDPAGAMNFEYVLGDYLFD